MAVALMESNRFGWAVAAAVVLVVLAVAVLFSGTGHMGIIPPGFTFPPSFGH